MRSLLLAGMVMLLAACKKDPPVPVAPPPPTAFAVPAPAPAPKDAGAPPALDGGAAKAADSGAAAADTGGTTSSLRDVPVGDRDSVAISAFAADCHHVFTVTADQVEGEEEKPECLARAFEQNCSPSGCWDSLQSCKDGCSEPCGGCQSACAGTCDDCKARCAGDGGCVRACARGRQDCRIGCLDKLEHCRTGCEEEATRCEDALAAQLKHDCPDCDGLRSCLVDAMDKPGINEGEANAKCLAKFPGTNSSCLDSCSPGQ